MRKEKKREIREDGNTFWSGREVRGGGGGGRKKMSCGILCLCKTLLYLHKQ